MQNPFKAIAKNMRQSGEKQRATPIQDVGETLVQNPGQTEIYTYFTAAPFNQSKLVFSPQSWVNVKLTLETAGPVSISTRDDVLPVLGGKGILLVTDREYEFSMPRGARLFMGATAANRVSIIIEPIPWLKAINAKIDQVTQAISGSARATVGAILKTRMRKSEPDEICPPRLKPPRF